MMHSVHWAYGEKKVTVPLKQFMHLFIYSFGVSICDYLFIGYGHLDGCLCHTRQYSPGCK